MARSLTSGMQTAVAAEKSTVVRFIQLESSAGTARWVTAPLDIAWNSQTWVAIGGALSIGGAQESSDLRAAGLSVTLSGVDGVVVAIVMQNAFRGYPVSVWRAHLSGGQIVADPLLEFRGFQNGAYKIVDDPKAEDGGGGTVTVTTRWVSRLARLQATLAVRTNLHSHRDYLRRGGLTGTALDDTIFRFLPGLAARVRLIRWGGSDIAPFEPLPGGGGPRKPTHEPYTG